LNEGCGQVNDVRQTIDGGFILAGEEVYRNEDGFGLLLIKFDQSGIEKWRGTTQEGWRGEPRSIRQTLDKGYIISNNRYYDERSFFEKIDQNGNYQWTKEFIYGQYGNYYTEIYSSIQTTDGSYIGVGLCFNCLGDDGHGFIIKLSQPNITVVSPNGGEKWVRGTIKQIKWSYTSNSGTYVKIELLKGGILNRVITSNTPNDGSYSWAIPVGQALGTDYKIRITSTSNSAYKDTSNGNFAISNPYITVISPNGGENWARGTAHTINWKKDGNVGSYVKIQLYKGGILNKVIISSTANDGSYNWIVPTTQTIGTDYKIKIMSTSNSAYYDWSNNNFRIY
jgi:hypothetical protein